ncbi:MAG: hypothetical protein RIT81_41960 [Deltaproteobacteria bacterium]
MSENPFAAPAVDPFGPATTGDTSVAGIWRDGDVIVMEKGAMLPDFCVKSGEPASERLEKKLQWHHPAVYAALLFNVIIYLIIALIMRKTANVSIPIGPDAKAHRSKWIKIGWGAGLGGLVVMFIGIPLEQPVVILLGLGVAFFGLIGGLIGVRLLWPTKIDDQYVYLKGAKEPFLRHLPNR